MRKLPKINRWRVTNKTGKIFAYSSPYNKARRQLRLLRSLKY